MIPFLDLQAAYRELAPELDAAWQRVARSGWYVLGEELAAFEAEFAARAGVRAAVGVGNGLDALELALRARGIGPGDEVIVPAHTFIATWLAVTRAGASVAPVDVDARTMTLDPAAVEAACTPRTRAVVPVHLYGQPADMDPILAVARRRELFVLEDAAQAHGARYRGRPVGALGDAAAFSFYPAKNLGALGDGGALVTDDAALADRLRRLRSYGAREKYVHEEAGCNSRLDELQAALLRVKLAHLEAWNQRRRGVAMRYLEALAGVPDLVLPSVLPDSEPVWHLFVVRHPRRDALAAWLAAHGIGTLIHYPTPPHRSPAYRLDRRFPIAEQLAATVLSLPMGPHLALDDATRVAEQIRRWPG
jgi:dTDP-4-amino-4,6-dideoxygalactose transaminase